MKRLLLLITVFISCAKIGNTQPGSLDLSFGTKGIIRADLGSAVKHNMSGKQVLLQSDGSMYILLSSDQTQIIKKRPNGLTDSTYGYNGLSGPVDISNASAAMQKDGKIVVVGAHTSNSYNQYYFSVARYNVDGSLDNTLNGNGKTLISFDYHQAYATSVAVQADGKIVVAGFANSNDGYVMALARLKTDGSLDNSFNGDGRQSTVVETEDINISVVIQTDGKIVLGGFNADHHVISRYNINGSLDSTFKSVGSLSNANGFAVVINSLSIQKDNKIVAAGFSDNSINKTDFAIVRFNVNGSLDKSFGVNGIRTTYFRTYNDYATSVAIQGDGKIVTVGYASNGLNNAFAITRHNTNGSIDNTFDTDGKKMTYIGSTDVYAKSVAIQSNGKIVSVGSGESNSNTSLKVIRYNTDGSFDNTFGSKGTLTDYFKQGNTVYTTSAVQSDGKLVAAGYTSNGSYSNFLVARYTIAGKLDNTFSDDGIQILDFGSSDNKVTSVAIQKDGKIVVTGGVSNGNNYDFGIVRFKSNGKLDSTFSGDGKVKIDFGHFEMANSLAIQSDGKMVVVGYTAVDGDVYSYARKFAIARVNPDGTVDKSFSGDGKAFNDFSGSSRSDAKSVSIQSDGKIVVVGYADDDYTTSSAICRYNTNGILDNTFSNDGMQITNFSDPEDDFSISSSATSVCTQKDGKIVVAGNGGYNEKYGVSFTFLFRYNSNGTQDNTFRGDGMSAPGGDYLRTSSMLLQDDGKILVAGLSGESDYDSDLKSITANFSIMRYNSDGTFDNRMGSVVTDISNSYDAVQSIAISKDKLYAVGSSNYIGNLGVVVRYLLSENKAPTVKITSPANNSNYKAPATFTVNATASDPDGIIRRVKFYNGGTLLKTDSTSPYTFTMTNVAAGRYSFVAKATDDRGLTTSSASVSVAVSVTANKAPVVSLTGPTSNAIYVAPSNITITANATDIDGSIKKVQFYKGGTLIKTDSTSPYTYTLNNVSPGTYSFTAKATDNKGLYSSSASVSVLVKANKAPAVEITSPTSYDDFTSPATVVINTQAYDLDGTISNVKFYNGSTYLKTVYTRPFTHTISNLPSGTYALTAKATDNNGAQTVSTPIKVVVNNPPTVSITSPGNDATFTGPATITVKALASDSDGKIASVKFYNNGVYLKTISVSPYTYTLNNLPAGTHTITLKATDNQGKETWAEPVTVTVVDPTIVSSKPLVTATSDIKTPVIKLYPNPAHNTINVSVEGLQQYKQSTLSVLAVSGIVLKTKQINTSSKTIQLDVSSLRKGVYMVKIQSGGTVLAKQFIKL